MDQAGSAHRVVIVVGGFAGLYAAKALKSAPVEVTLVDRRNFHLFQPLLYQVATGALSPGEIASPLRFVLRKHKNTRVLLGEVVDLDPARRTVALAAGGEVSRAELSYDTLVLATGSCPHHFGRQDWEQAAPGLKSIEDATNMRGRILLAFERAEREPDPDARRQWLTFVIVGGGPTGVELAGALAEIANDTLKNDFRAIDPSEARILILEGSDRVLPSFPAGLSAAAEKALLRLGARAITASLVTAVDAQGVTYRRGGQDCRIASRTVLWAAGVQASPLGRLLAERAGAELDRGGRVIVEADLTVPGRPEILVIGDLACYPHQGGRPLPGVAPVAMQQGSYAARLIRARLERRAIPPFRYRRKGDMATIGRHEAVADFGRFRFAGFFAWLLWLFVHLMYLVEFDNRLLVFTEWAYNYFTFNRGARLITERGSEAGM